MPGFPADWPQGCPPPDAVDACGDVFRNVKTIPPTIEDFTSHAERGTCLKAPQCLRVGLSVFQRALDAMHNAELFPRLGEHVAKATLAPSHGKTKATPSKDKPSHTTWWPYADIDRAALFSQSGDAATSVEPGERDHVAR